MFRVEESVSLLISDNGIGISDIHLSDVCNRGVSIDKKHGNGLGLYHARETIEDIGGRLIINSVHRIGTFIEMNFPCAV